MDGFLKRMNYEESKTKYFNCFELSWSSTVISQYLTIQWAALNMNFNCSKKTLNDEVEIGAKGEKTKAPESPNVKTWVVDFSTNLFFLLLRYAGVHDSRSADELSSMCRYQTQSPAPPSASDVL